MKPRSAGEFVRRHMLFRRAFVSSIALAAVLLASSASAQSTPQTLLIGTWRHTVLIRIIGDQALEPQRMAGDSYLEFKPDGTWTSTAPYNKSAGTYRWLDQERIETTVLASGLLIQIGLVSAGQVRVDENRLNLIRVQTAEEAAKFLAPVKAGSPPYPNVMLTSIFTRVGER